MRILSARLVLSAFCLTCLGIQSCLASDTAPAYNLGETNGSADAARPLPGGDAPPGAYLQGKVTVLGPGTHFRCQLDNTLDTTYTREGEEFQATVTEPVILNGQVAIPTGSKLTGQVTKVVSPRNFSFGTNGRIDVKFVAVQTPDGRRFPINASIDVKMLQAAGGAHNPGGRAVSSMKHGAVTGMKYGAAGGALYGMATTASRSGIMRGSNSMLGRGLKMGAAGALAGSVLGAGAGLVSSGVKKGSEVHVPVGTNLPVQLDDALTMDATNAPPAVQQPAFGWQQQSYSGQQYGNFSQPGNAYNQSGQQYGNFSQPGNAYNQSGKQYGNFSQPGNAYNQSGKQYGNVSQPGNAYNQSGQQYGNFSQPGNAYNQSGQ